MPFSSSKRWNFRRDLIGSFPGPDLLVQEVFDRLELQVSTSALGLQALV